MQSGFVRFAVVLAVALALHAAISGGAQAATLEVSPTGQPEQFIFGFEPPSIEGFDGVTFGMSMEEVEQKAAELYPGAELAWLEDRVKQTNMLHVTLESLSPVRGTRGVGPATITYVFGSQSQRLIAINLNWYLGAERGATLEERASVLALGTMYVAELLRYAWGSGMAVRGIVTGPNDVVLFAGRDLEGRGVEVVAEGVPLDVMILPEGIEEYRPIETGPVRLRIAFAAQPEDPDVFAIPPGAF